MHLGFSSMNTAHDPDPITLAKRLEELGYDSLWYGEHSHIPCSRKTPYPAGGDMPAPYRQMMDPYVSLMAAAAVTSKLKIGTGIALLMERDVFSQAKTIATLDHLSNGRVIIGTGVGWNEEEFANVNPHPWNKRYTVMRETVEAMRELWNEEEASYQGEFVKFEPVWSAPKPIQAGGPKIIFGAMGPLGVKHAAKWADGWFPVDVALPNIETAVSEFKQMVEDNGRDPNSVEITLQVMDSPTPDKLKRFRDMGFDRCNIGVSMDMWDKPDQFLPMIEKFADVIPELKG
ncbi:MAG: LLM class F420-dependent oxidoreductase [Spongiibacteraceae bacterium]|jgi:probable F420-dependent oxidoreductase|nr:LLM class F420-dependent oxidoreductase [Spongiibacteraceae bacterium]